MISTKNIWMAIVAVAIIAVLGLFMPVLPAVKQIAEDLGISCISDSVTCYTAVNVEEGYFIDGNSFLDGSGNMNVTGTTTVNTFAQGGGVYATSTAGNSTLLGEALDTENVISHTLTGGVGTLTLMSSSSAQLVSRIPNAGDEFVFTIINASTSVNAILTVAGGTGMTMKRAASSTATVIGDTDGLNNFRITLTRIATGGNILMDVVKYED